MNDKNCTSCGRLISEHILCSYDKVSLYCPGGPGPSKEEELKHIKTLLALLEKSSFLSSRNLNQNLNKTE